MSERILGIRFLEPGAKKISVKPDLGDLEYVRGTLPSPFGAIKVEADRSGKCRIDAPAGVEAVE